MLELRLGSANKAAYLGLQQATHIQTAGTGTIGAVAAAVAAGAAVDKQRRRIDAGCVGRIHHGGDGIHEQVIAHVEEIVEEGAILGRAADGLLKTLQVLIGNLQGAIHGLAVGLLHCSRCTRHRLYRTIITIITLGNKI